MTEIQKLLLQKVECEDAILALMKDNRGGDYFFIRGVIESLIFKIEARIKALETK